MDEAQVCGRALLCAATLLWLTRARVCQLAASAGTAMEFQAAEREPTGAPHCAAARVTRVADKYELLPAFLRVRGLVKQHIDSFNYLVEQEVRAQRRSARATLACLPDAATAAARCAKLCRPRPTSASPATQTRASSCGAAALRCAAAGRG